MASSKVQFFNFRTFLLLCLLFLHVSFLYASPFAFKSLAQTQKKEFMSRRKTLAIENEELPKKKNTIGKKNQTKLIKPTTNSTKTSLSKPIKSPTNSTKTNLSKPIKTPSNSTKIHLKNLTSTSNSSNPTKSNSSPTKNSPNLLKSISPADKTKNKEKPTSQNTKNDKSDQTNQQKTQNQPKTKPTQLLDFETDDDNLTMDFQDLRSKFHNDLETFSTTSKAYITKANQEITQGFKPLFGNKYAPFIASLISCTFLIVPLIILSLLYTQIKTHFSLQKTLIFIQVYLSIYFSILSLSYFVTGLEPLKFFYATSMTSYIPMQVIQTLGYVFYLLMQLLSLVLVFSRENGLGSRFLGLAQMLVGLAVGLHYYLTVFHRAVLHQPPKTNWKVHGIYASCFFVICLFSGADRRKKAYLQDGGRDDGKKS
ncbi:uncharacterized protein LOC143889565 [Tasmannia lanceolata]|uniref:uncharacterized protein LOC143889565 n=1 Tax=Tasmannia lanceolata TaxID=3420 RepID=UPI00406398A5